MSNDAVGELVWELRNIAEDAGPGKSRDLAMNCVRHLNLLRHERNAARADLVRLIASYIHESPRPDCEPTMRFRAVLALGIDRWCSTRLEGIAAVRRAAGLEPGKEG